MGGEAQKQRQNSDRDYKGVKECEREAEEEGAGMGDAIKKIVYHNMKYCRERNEKGKKKEGIKRIDSCKKHSPICKSKFLPSSIVGFLSRNGGKRRQRQLLSLCVSLPLRFPISLLFRIFSVSCSSLFMLPILRGHELSPSRGFSAR